MYNRLKELGLPVTLTRDTDETLTRTERIRRMLAPYGNGSDVLVISNHINAGGGDGAEVIYALRNNDTLAKSILEGIGQTGQNMRKYFQRRLPSDPSKDYYYIMRDTPNAETVLIEYGFLDSPDDDVKQLKENNLDMVEAAVRAITEYAGYNYIPPTGSNMYAVKAGDSLYKIANQFGISVDELIAANNLQNNILQIGQILTIPKKEELPPSEYEVYTVKSGDSLYKIANQFNVTIDDIIELNNLSTTLLQLNQQLLIPKEVSQESGIYVVKSGDSLYKIALQYGLTVDELIKANNLSSTTLQIGQELFIPGLNVEDDMDKPSNNEITYIVQSGDSLWSIAKKYGVLVNELKEYNNLTTNMLSIGQKLLIPQTQNYTTYIVQSGDSLYKIANEYGTTVNELKAINNLTSNALSIGQVLLIP